ncbi:MAG: PQQ-binding-like beta-propeller repeat protein [Flavobacteriaceae bacterium]
MKYSILSIISILICGACSTESAKDQLNNNAWENIDFRNWSHYLGDPARTHFSTLNQIDSGNVHRLKLKWTYKSGGLSDDRSTQIQTNPLIASDILYGVNAVNSLFAVKAATGEPLWTFIPTNTDQTGLGLSRGLMHWQGQGEQKSRLLFTSGFYLFAVDAETGVLIKEFGQEGRIDLRKNLGRDPKKIPIVVTTPGVIYKDRYIIGCRTSESPGAAPGHIRSYNLVSGELEWIFHTIPQPGEYGYDTWPAQAYKTTGGANNWAGMALDEERGIVYVPTGSAAFDWYGGDRVGDNLFANSLIALNAENGERLWHFQMVHHDVWDRDLPAPPNLLEIERDGKLIPAVAQITKSGHVFLFNRIDGKPLFPIEEKPFPVTTLEGDTTSPTQPLPLKPKPFARQILLEEDLYAPDEPAFVDDFIDKDQNIEPPTVMEKFRDITSNGQFIPIDTKGVILYPGADGGAEWGGAAVDPRTGIMYVNSNEMAWIVRMAEVGGDEGEDSSWGQQLSQVHCARCHGGQLEGLGIIPELKNVKDRLSVEEISNIILNGKGTMVGLPNLSEDEIKGIAQFLHGIEEEGDHRTDRALDMPYAMVGFGRFKDSRGFPVMKPPWGTLNAIDLNTGDYLWTIPLGHEESLKDPLFPVSGTENYGGPVITAGGVLFIAATKDEKFRAFNMVNGELLWETDLPAGGYATPASYKVDGKQYIVIACGGGKMGTPSGDRYLAFTLE